MVAHLAYLRYVLRHKWYVLIVGLRLGGVSLWRLLKHDWSKFTPAEWPAYVAHFYGPARAAVLAQETPNGASGYLSTPGADEAFDRAWAHHWRTNDHHWQHWLMAVNTGDDHVTLPLMMSPQAAREMVADWIGAGLAQGNPDAIGWYRARSGQIALHSATRSLVEQALLEARQRKIIP